MTKQQPLKISYCTSCKGRLEHLKQTLPANLNAEKQNPHVEFVVLDYGDTDGLGEWIHEHFQPEIESGRLRYARFETEYFRMAHAKNMSHRVATGDILCNVDADNFLAPNFSRWLEKTFKANPQSVVTSLALTPAGVLKQRGERILKGKSPALSRDGGIGGRIAIRADNFYRLGGYDERIEGWGPDDLQFCLRARDSGLEAVRIPPDMEGRSIDHSNETRLQELSPQAKDQSSKLMSRHPLVKAAVSLKRVKTRYDIVQNPDGFGRGDVTINFNQHQQLGAQRVQPVSETPQVSPVERHWRETIASSPGVERSQGL